MRKTLIVVDMQNDFINGSLGTKEAQAIVQNVRNKIGEYQERGDEIIFTRDTHQKDYLNTPEGRKLPVEHCIEGTKGWQIADGLEAEGAVYIDKPTFGWTHWKDRTSSSTPQQTVKRDCASSSTSVPTCWWQT